jgi:ATP-dependent exoDNAse (exonuclease V) beta subunit
VSTSNLLQLDAVNRERALDLLSFIVEAPAGAGKTELLTQRYLKLLSIVQEPEEIIAVTFTNKAAAEMRCRILDSLQLAAAGKAPNAAHKRITFDLATAALQRSAVAQWDLLAQPGRLRITTIDALSSLLARQMPLLSRFGAQPGVSDDASIHYREAARRALAMLENEGGVGPVTEALRYFDNDSGRLADLLAQMLARRDQWLHHAGRRSTQEEVEAALRHLVEHDIRRAAKVLHGDLQARLMPLARYAAANLPCEHPVALLLDWTTPIPATAEALPLWRCVCELLLTGDGGWRKTLDKRLGFPATDEGRSRKQELLDALAILPDPQPLARLRDLPDARHGDAEWEIVGSLARLLQLAAAQLWTVFQEAGEVDFVEMASRALAALEDESGPTDLALSLDYRIRHLLVDEFQDTSPGQVKLLEKLTAGWEPEDGRTLFCVGDPMQSIYRFRKADVGLFLQAAQFGIGGLRLQRLQLTRNNRSCPPVVEWVNRAFAAVFPTQDSETRGAIRYRPFAAGRDSQPGAGVLVHPLVLVEGASSAALAQQEARYVADLIERERAEYPGRSIAVLVRARAHLKSLVEEIRRHRPHLRFQAVEVEQLAERQGVQDVLALTRALLHRADRVNWLALLRAPWCGLRLADLHTLAADDHNTTVWQLMQDEERLGRMSEDGRQRLLHVRAVIGRAFAHQGRQSLRRWLEGVWLQLGGPQCLWEAGDVRDVQAFFDLVERLQAAGGGDVIQLETALTELYAAVDVQADSTLQFMTVHKSKGLEFDTVILPGLHRVPRKADAPLLLWEEVAIEAAESQLVAAPWVPKYRRKGLPGAYDYLQGLEQERGANEATRVLYVAATRAERRLHLVGAVAQSEKGDLKPPAQSFLEALWGTLGEEFAQSPPQVAAPTIEASAFVPRLIRLSRPKVPELLSATPQPSTTAHQHDASSASDEVAGLEANCGTLAHLYLEMIARDGLEEWPAERIQNLQPAMRRWLIQQGHDKSAAELGAHRVAAVLTTTLLSESGRWVLQPRDSAASELALVMAEAGGTSLHRVDRTFVEGGVRWIIDYKSDSVPTDMGEVALQNLAERYRPQLQRYVSLFAADQRPVRLAVLFLASGRLVELLQPSD